MNNNRNEWKKVLAQTKITRQEATEFALAVAEVITDENWETKQYGRDTVFTTSERNRLQLSN